MKDSLSDYICDKGPVAFSKEEVGRQSCLFAHRCALFYTPTENLPLDVVGKGNLDVVLPLPTPDYLDSVEIRSYASPRLWVDLLQRNTTFIRWSPFFPAQVIITRYDFIDIGRINLIAGAKGLLDALKVSTTGRRDGKKLYYFGAIVDDDLKSVDVEYKQIPERDIKRARVRVQVFPL